MRRIVFLIVALGLALTGFIPAQAENIPPPITCLADASGPATGMTLILDGSATTTIPTFTNDCTRTDRGDGRLILQQITVSCGATSLYIAISMDRVGGSEGIDPYFMIATKCWPSGGSQTLLADSRIICNSLAAEVHLSIQEAQMNPTDRTPIMTGCQALPVPTGVAKG